MVSWVFFHRERRIDEYGKKRGLTFIKNLFHARHNTSYLRHIDLCTYEILPKLCLSVRVQLQNTNTSLVT